MGNVNTPQNSPPTKKQKGQMGNWARYYDLIMTLMTFGRENKLRQMTVRLAQLMPGDKVLEIGCGTGTLTLAVKAQVGLSGEAVGIDIAPEMIAVAQHKAARKAVEINFRVASIANIPFPDNYFDAVLCSFMIFHVPEDVRKSGFKEIFRVLKSGGHYFIFDAASNNKHYDVRELTPDLKANTFTEIEVEKIKFLYMKGWFLRSEVRKT